MRVNWKAVKAIPVKKVSKAGEIAVLVSHPELIIIDCYSDKKHIGRYVMNPDNMIYKAFIDGKWVIRRLSGVFDKDSYSQYYYNSIRAEFENASKEKEAKQYVSTKLRAEGWYADTALDIVSRAEYIGNSNKSEAAYNRKRRKIEDITEALPKLPTDWLDWVKQTLPLGKYAIRDKEKGVFVCNVCNKTFDSKATHNRHITCLHCNTKLIAKTRTDRIETKYHIQFIQNMDTMQSVSRFFTLKHVSDIHGPHFVMDEGIIILLPKDGNKEKTKIYYEQSPESRQPVVFTGQVTYMPKTIWTGNPANRRFTATYLYSRGIAEALKDTAYEPLRLEEMAESGRCMEYNRIMAAGEQAAFMEYLVKMRLYRLAAEESSKFYWVDWQTMRHTTYLGSLNTHGRTPEQLLGMDRQTMHRLQNIDGGVRAREWLAYCERAGKKLNDTMLAVTEELQIDVDDVTEQLKYMSPEQAINYISKCREQYPAKKVEDICTTWSDYLSMAARLGYNVNDSVVNRTKDLYRRHDELVEQIRQQGDDLYCCNIAMKFPEAERNMAAVADKFEYDNGTLCMIAPRRISDVVKDGQQLHHCAASSNRYFERINRKETYLLFLRKSENKDKAWYTVEAQSDGTVRQKRTMFNRQEEIKEVNKFIREWQKVIRKRLTKEDIEAGSVSTVQNELSLIELLIKGCTDTSSVRVANELANDFISNSKGETA